MAKNLTLTLNADEIKLAVKSDSYITGQIDKSADMVKNAALAFNEQAGDETYHETKLYRTMKGALAKFESAIAEYVETSDPTATVTDTLTSSLGSFQITIKVNDRTSGAFATTIAHLAQEYIINTMLYYWWQPIKPALAKDYLVFSQDNLTDVRRCLAKSAPTASASSYDDISGSVTPIGPQPSPAQSSLVFDQSECNIQIGTTFSTPSLTKVPSDATVTYTSSNENVATVNETTGEVTLVATGTTEITATFAGNQEYTASTASYTLRVFAEPSPLG